MLPIIKSGDRFKHRITNDIFLVLVTTEDETMVSYVGEPMVRVCNQSRPDSKCTWLSNKHPLFCESNRI